jgi:pimeloyl-ACP methyl ester carboxylesterase
MATVVSMSLRRSTVVADGLSFACLEAGDSGPLALCLHGFPDTAHTWRHLLPALADAGYRAVAPFMRGYAPTEIPADGFFQTGALAHDAVALHDALGGDGDAVLIGHDWGALAAYGGASFAPERWRRVVTAAVPPPGSALMSEGMTSYDQLRRSWYMFFFQVAGYSDAVVAKDGLEFIRRLWGDWSPGFDATEDMVHLRESLGASANLEAALGYYRATWGNGPHDPGLAAEQTACGHAPPQPTLYLHGRDDGCMGVAMAGDALDVLSPGSEAVVLDGCGHFLQLERPDEFNAAVLDFLAR